MEGNLRRRDEAQPGESARKLLQRDLRLELPERRSDAIVDAYAEGECPLRVCAAWIEALALREDRRIVAGRGEPEKQLRARWDRYACDRLHGR